MPAKSRESLESPSGSEAETTPVSPASLSRKVLAISGTIPGEAGVGGVILGDLCRSFPSDCLRFICVSQAAQPPSEFEASVDHIIPRRFEGAFRPLSGYAGDAVSWLAKKCTFDRYCDKIVSHIVDRVESQKAEVIWAVLDCPTVIYIATAVSKRLGIPLVVLVWDSPELLAHQLHQDRWSTSRLMTMFEKCVQSATRVGVICEKMADEYRRRYGVIDSIVVRHGVDPGSGSQPQRNLNNDEFVIGFAGSITAKKAFSSLVAALDKTGWKINGRKATLRLIGARYLLDARTPQHIEYFGWRTNEETIGLLSQCHLLYLPQPFSHELRLLAELSFPTKLTTYAAAGRPMLIHGPEYASVIEFLSRYRIGEKCCSLQSNSVIESINRLCRTSPDVYLNAIQKTRTNELSASTFLDRFTRLVTV